MKEREFYMLREIMLAALFLILSLTTIFILIIIGTMSQEHNNGEYKCRCEHNYVPPVEG